MDSSEILSNIRKIVRAINLESKRIEKEYGISIPQLLCLKFLNEQNSFQATHKELKDYLQLNASTVTGLINRLEKKGLVAKLPSGGDKRRIPVTITAKGAEMLENIPDPLHEQTSNSLKELDPGKREELEKAFRLIIEFLGIEDIDAAPIITAEADFSDKEGD
jgi:DNA-binding MarR family transcriptional regulator